MHARQTGHVIAVGPLRASERYETFVRAVLALYLAPASGGLLPERGSRGINESARGWPHLARVRGVGNIAVVVQMRVMGASGRTWAGKPSWRLDANQGCGLQHRVGRTMAMEIEMVCSRTAVGEITCSTYPYASLVDKLRESPRYVHMVVLPVIYAYSKAYG